MTQFQHTLKALLEGRKTETSRIVKAGSYERQIGTSVVRSTVDERGKTDTTLWILGRDYAIEPHRGARSVGRYRVKAIWRQDVRQLLRAQIEAEGFSSMRDFLETWCKMHDPKALLIPSYPTLMKRPAERYQAWRMTIKVLWDTVDWNAPAVRALHINPFVVD